MRMGKLAGAVAATLLGAAPLAGAAHGDEGLPKGIYVGASIGHGIFKFWDDEVDRCATDGSCRTANNGLVYSVYAGFEFSPYIAIEAGWTSHEALEVKYNYNAVLCQDRSAAHGGELSAWSVYAAAVGRPPIDTGRFRPFGKAGMYRWTSEGKITCSSGVYKTRDDDVKPLVGAGVDVELTERVGLRAEWSWFTESRGGTHAFLGGLNFKF